MLLHVCIESCIHAPINESSSVARAFCRRGCSRASVTMTSSVITVKFSCGLLQNALRVEMNSPFHLFELLRPGVFFTVWRRLDMVLPAGRSATGMALSSIRLFVSVRESRGSKNFLRFSFFARLTLISASGSHSFHFSTNMK